MRWIFRPIRVLGKQWKLGAVAIFSLSIAMALGVLSLSITNTFLLLPPAAVDPDRLVMIYTRWPTVDIDLISYPDYKYFRDNNHVFTDIAVSLSSINVTTTNDSGREVKLVSRPVSDNYFGVLGFQPFLGRFFSPADAAAKTQIAVMTYGCWKRLGEDPKIVGRVLGKHKIIGVAPKEFTGSFFGFNGDLLTSLSGEEDTRWSTDRDARGLVPIARLKPEVSRDQAQSEMATLSAQLVAAYPKEEKGLQTFVTRATMLPPDVVPDAEMALAVLITAVVLVLLVACTNVANLLLAIAVGRRQEAAIKLALGAQRRQLIREFLRESAVICSVSAIVGYVIASGLISRFSNLTFDLPMLGSYSVGIDLRLDATVAIFTGTLILIATIATGLGPALYASSPNLAEILSGEIAVGGTRKRARRNALVVVQVAMCTLALVGTGLCVRSLYNLRRADLGFSARNFLAMMIFAPDGSSEVQARQFYERARSTVAALPGVESVAFASELPLGLGIGQAPAQLPEEDRKLSVGQSVVDGDYFATLGIQILSGRVFNSGDGETSSEVVVINRNMAETFWPGKNPLGKTFVVGDPGRRVTVIGVAADGKYEAVTDNPRPAMYYAMSQHYQPTIKLIAKTQDDPHLWVDPINKTMRSLNADLLFAPLTFADLIDFTLLWERFAAYCIAALSGLALLLTVLGLFGAISYSVSERKKEIGIRVALGARPRELMKMVLGQTLRITGLGVASGIMLGVAATVLLRSEFYGISPIELSVLIPVSLAMLAISLLVAYLSARPWIAVDPMEAVRHT